MADLQPVDLPTEKERQRFHKNVVCDPRTGCWEWTGLLFAQGYGAFYFRNKVRRAHRVLYVWTHGEPGIGLDHLCRNRACVNPEHLSPATPRQNVIERGFSPAALNARKTHCVNGHEFTEENTFIDHGGWRQCRTCRTDRGKKRREERRDEFNARKRELRVRVDHPPRPCEECGRMFTPKKSDARFCRSACQQRSARLVRLGRK